MISQHDALRLKCTAPININGVHDICFVFEIREREVKTLRISTQHKPDWRPLTDDINTLGLWLVRPGLWLADESVDPWSDTRSLVTCGVMCRSWTRSRYAKIFRQLTANHGHRKIILWEICRNLPRDKRCSYERFLELLLLLKLQLWFYILPSSIRLS